MNIPRPKLNLIELAFYSALVAVVAYVLGVYVTERRVAPFMTHDSDEVQALATRYGPTRHSASTEEWILRDFFKERRNGVFVEVGANHHERASNTYYLEKSLGWSGVAIEPQVKFAAGYAEHRPRTTFVPLFISDVSNEQATLYVAEGNDSVASAYREFAEGFGEVTPTTATSSTLDDVLDRLGTTHIDFLSIDIELAEPQALAGFSIRRFMPALVAIEAHPPIRQQILEYFARNAYVLVGRYWRADGRNFWFSPLDDSAPLVQAR